MDLNDFNVPEGFELPAAQKSIGNNVEAFDYSSGATGVPYRFAEHARPWPMEKQKRYRYAGHDLVEVLMFYQNKTTVTPRRLIKKRDINGNFIEGEWELPPDHDREPYRTAYKRWKEGRSQPGTSLEKAGIADNAQVAELAALGVFSVEALSDKSEGWIDQTFPQMKRAVYRDLHEQALFFVAAKTGIVDAKAQGDKISVLEAQNNALASELDNLRAKIKGTTKPRGRPKKVTDES